MRFGLFLMLGLSIAFLTTPNAVSQAESLEETGKSPVESQVHSERPDSDGSLPVQRSSRR